MNAYGRAELQLHSFFATAVNGSECSAWRLAALPAGKYPSASIELETVRSSGALFCVLEKDEFLTTTENRAAIPRSNL